MHADRGLKLETGLSLKQEAVVHPLNVYPGHSGLAGNMNDSDVVILAATRTPMGVFQGSLAGVSSPTLGAQAIAAVLELPGMNPAWLAEVYMGCVVSAGLGQAPARQAALAAGVSQSVPCTTVNKVCGSGMKALMLAADQLRLCGQVSNRGKQPLAWIAGGMESMSQAPYLIDKARQGLRLGHGQLVDALFCDGLEDAYGGQLMGYYAEQTAAHYGIGRERMDEYTRRSLACAQAVDFSAEITPVTTPRGEVVAKDEGPLRVRTERIATLEPAFSAQGSITAANASSIADGAAALLLMSAAEARAEGLKPLARIHGYCSYAGDPHCFSEAPVTAIRQLLQQADWRSDEVDLYEINEAFAAVPLLVMDALELPLERVNVAGGACVLGHPLGASGARILVTLLHNLQRLQLRTGVAALCIGGGEATAMAIERL